MDRTKLLFWALAVEGGFFALALYLTAGERIWESALDGLTWRATLYIGIFTVPMLAVLYALLQSSVGTARRMRDEFDEKVMPLFAQCETVDFFVISLLAGAGEEFFFRGWMQPAIVDSLGMWAGIGLASLVFGLAHSISVAYAVYAALIGVYLGTIFEVSGNLYLVAGIHALYDFGALVYLKRVSPPDAGAYPSLYEDDDGARSE